jgi:hypothetical protein
MDDSGASSDASLPWARGRTVFVQLVALFGIAVCCLVVFVEDAGCSLSTYGEPTDDIYCNSSRVLIGSSGGLLTIVALIGGLVAIVGCVISQVQRSWRPAAIGLGFGGVLGVALAWWALGNQ